MDTKQPEALRLAGVLRAIDARSRFANAQLTSASEELETLHAENEALRTGYDAARLEIESLRERVQQLEAVGAGGVSAPVGASQSRQAGAEPVAQWQKRHPNKEYGLWQNTDEGDAKWWRDKAGTPGWEARALYAAPQPPAQAGEQNHLPLAITSAPERIWLDLGVNPYEDDVHFSNLHDLTWSQDNATGDGIEYVRADLAARGAYQAAPAPSASIEQEAMQMLWNDQQQEEKEHYRNVARGAERIK